MIARNTVPERFDICARDRCGWVGSFLVWALCFKRAAGHTAQAAMLARVIGCNDFIVGASKQCSCSSGRMLIFLWPSRRCHKVAFEVSVVCLVAVLFAIGRFGGRIGVCICFSCLPSSFSVFSGEVSGE